MTIQSTVRHECEHVRMSIRSAFDLFVEELDMISQEHILLLQDSAQVLEEQAANKLRAHINNTFQHGN